MDCGAKALRLRALGACAALWDATTFRNILAKPCADLPTASSKYGLCRHLALGVDNLFSFVIYSVCELSTPAPGQENTCSIVFNSLGEFSDHGARVREFVVYLMYSFSDLSDTGARAGELIS